MEQRKTFQFRTLTKLLIAGLSGCGKTTFTTRLLLDNTDLFSKTPEAIHCCYGSWQKGFKKLKEGGLTKESQTSNYSGNGFQKDKVS